tara:strand:- start:2565 stop:3095 length:531 start_codon:yes stop_codon:yes gene_type:complete
MSLGTFTFARTCTQIAGGLAALWVIAVEDIDTVTVVAGEITALTLVATKVWTKLSFEPDTAYRINDMQNEGGALPVAHEIGIIKNGITLADTLAIKEMSRQSSCGLAAVAKDMSGLRWLEGYSELLGFDRGLSLKQAKFDSGKVITDVPNVDLQFSSLDMDYALPLASGLPDPATS